MGIDVGDRNLTEPRIRFLCPVPTFVLWCVREKERACARVHVSVDMPAHHVSAISGSLLPSWFPHSGSQSVCSAIGSTQLTAATAACQLAAAKSHYCSLRLSESLGGSPHAYPPSFIDLTCPNQENPTTGQLTVSSP